MPSGASVVRASVAVLLDQPFGVVAGGEGADVVDVWKIRPCTICSLRVRNKRSMTPLSGMRSAAPHGPAVPGRERAIW
jgi:hypothetical protein